MTPKCYLGDCLVHLRTFADASVDSLITDPPAGIGFMNRSWDSDKGGRDAWIKWMTEVMAECLRVLKPGAHGLIWSLPRTSHWTATALEDAGFEIRDVVTHLFSTGFPKSKNIAIAIDKEAGLLEARGKAFNTAGTYAQRGLEHTSGAAAFPPHEPISEEAKKWQGFGSALKPAAEFWVLVRKPLSEKTLASNVLRHGTGAVNIDQTRIKPISQQRDDDVYIRLSSLCSAADKKSVPASLSRDYLERIFFELCTYSKDGNRRLRNAHGQGDRQHLASEYALLVALLFPNGAWCGLKSKLPGDFQVDCPAYRRFCDEHAHALLRACQDGAPSLRDALGGIFPFLSDKKHTPLSQHIDRLSSEGDSDLSSCVRFLLSFPINITYSSHPQGRFPSNLLLSHNHDCEEVGTKKVKGIAPPGLPSRGKPEDSGSSWAKGNTTPNLIKYADADGTETVPAWRCTPGCAVAELDGQSGNLAPQGSRKLKDCPSEMFAGGSKDSTFYGDSGGASRFFYVAKASKKDKGSDNAHPTVKSTKLMEYLIRLVSPPGGIVLDPFMGSGSTGVAALKGGFGFIGIEQDPSYVATALTRWKAFAVDNDTMFNDMLVSAEVI